VKTSHTIAHTKTCHRVRIATHQLAAYLNLP